MWPCKESVMTYAAAALITATATVACAAADVCDLEEQNQHGFDTRMLDPD